MVVYERDKPDLGSMLWECTFCTALHKGFSLIVNSYGKPEESAAQNTDRHTLTFTVVTVNTVIPNTSQIFFLKSNLTDMF